MNHSVLRRRKGRVLHVRRRLDLYKVESRIGELIESGAAFRETDIIFAADMAAMLQVSTKTLRRWVNEKRLIGHVGANRKLYFLKSDFKKEPDLVTKGGTYLVKDVAREFGLVVGTIRGWIAMGRLSARKIGAKWVIAREDLQDFLEAGLMA